MFYPKRCVFTPFSAFYKFFLWILCHHFILPRRVAHSFGPFLTISLYVCVLLYWLSALGVIRQWCLERRGFKDPTITGSLLSTQRFVFYNVIHSSCCFGFYFSFKTEISFKCLHCTCHFEAVWFRHVNIVSEVRKTVSPQMQINF